MPSPDVIDLTLSDEETQPDPIRSNQGTSILFFGGSGKISSESVRPA